MGEQTTVKSKAGIIEQAEKRRVNCYLTIIPFSILCILSVFYINVLPVALIFGIIFLDVSIDMRYWNLVERIEAKKR